MNERTFCVLLEDDLTSGEMAEAGLDARSKLTIRKPADGRALRVMVETFHKGEETPFRIGFGPLCAYAAELRNRYGLNGPRLAGYLMKQRAPVDVIREASEVMREGVPA